MNSRGSWTNTLVSPTPSAAVLLRPRLLTDAADWSDAIAASLSRAPSESPGASGSNRTAGAPKGRKS
jgi:hypothetical protein